MDEKNDFTKIDYGLNVVFDGRQNMLIWEGGTIEYPIGAMVCEYSRLHPMKIKDVIVACPQFKEKYSIERIDAAFSWITSKLIEKYSVLTGTMIATELLQLACDFIPNADNKDYLEGMKHEVDPEDSIKKFVFHGTSLSEFGSETVGQLFLTAYYMFASSFAVFKLSLDAIISPEGDELGSKRMEAVLSMYSRYIEMQHIDFRIIAIEGKFASLYTIKSSMSLFLFEIAHAIDAEVTIVKCQNCGNYFVPEGRSDAVYCSFRSPQNPNKMCKEIGAQITRANKEKNDVATKSYRKVYMRYVMHMNRHPGDKKKQAMFNQLTQGVREWRKNMEDGTATVEQFLDWLNGF